jgi:transcriptional regulator with GAF, ATPase, and Fis domain
MSTLSQINSVHGWVGELGNRDTTSGASKVHPTHPSVHPKVGLKSSYPDSRIAALKVLARALSNEIEDLAERTGLNEAVELNLQTEVNRFEAQLIRAALITTGGSQRRAARLLGMKATSLNRRIKRYGIRVDKTTSQEDSHDEHVNVSFPVSR